MLGPVNVKKIPPKQAKEEAMAHLERMGLAHKADQYPQNLSGGEKQRVAVARALCMSSDILLMDEPTSALDPLMTGEVLRTIQSLAQEGITLMIVTHEVAFAKLVADRILFFDQGSILVDAPPSAYEDLQDHPVAKRYFDQLSLQCA
jgi:ABC-type polar amino acid transport system ATPase subunit